MKKLVLGVAVLTLGLYSCNKDVQNGQTEQVINSKSVQLTIPVETVVANESAVENSMAMASFEVDLFTASRNSFSGFNFKDKKRVVGLWALSHYKLGKCPNVTIDSAATGFPKTITLDYGTATTLDNDRVVSGKIIVEISAAPLTNGSTRLVTFQNLVIDSITISGTETRTFTGNIPTSRMFSGNVDLKFTFADGTFITRKGQRSIEWMSGLETELDPSDDLIQINGYVDVTDSDANVYRREITTPLTKNGSCPFIVSGVITITQNAAPFAILDYGTGECDNVATLNANGVIKEITLGKTKKGVKQDPQQTPRIRFGN